MNPDEARQSPFCDPPCIMRGVPDEEYAYIEYTERVLTGISRQWNPLYIWTFVPGDEDAQPTEYVMCRHCHALNLPFSIEELPV